MEKFFDLNEEARQVVREIMSYKWLESEKAGRDIGESEAAKEWISKHYDAWFQANSHKFVKQSH